MSEPRPKGRPKGQPYPIKKLIRLTAQDAAELEQMRDRWRCSDAEAIRRCIRETFQRQ